VRLLRTIGTQRAEIWILVSLMLTGGSVAGCQRGSPSRAVAHAHASTGGLDKQGIAYRDGHSCVRTTLSAFAKAHLTKNITTVKGAHRLSQKIVVSCDRGAEKDRVKGIAWFKMGASDAVADLFGEPSARAACLLSPDCGASPSTVAYFERLQQAEP
jgi:hypothetical protein